MEATQRNFELSDLTYPIVKGVCAFIIAICLGFIVLVGVNKGSTVALDYVTEQKQVLTDWAMEKISRVELVPTIAEKIPLEKLIESTAKKYKIPKVLLQAVVEKESAGDNSKWRYHFEEEKFKKFVANGTYPNLTEDEVRMMASSHGMGQVMGFNALPECGVTWDQLYDRGTGIDCAGNMLAKKFHAAEKNTKDIAQRIWLTFKSYNGSGPAAENYADKTVKIMNGLLFAQLTKEITVGDL